MRQLLTFVFLLFLSNMLIAQYGYLDSSYANNGKQNYPDFNPYLYYDRGLSLIEQSDNAFMLVGDIIENNQDGVWLPVLKFKNDIADSQILCPLDNVEANFNLKCAVTFGGNQSDKFLIAGSRNEDIFIKKFDSDGNIDINFGQGGEIIQNLGGKDVVYAMERLSNGHFFVIIRSGDQLIIRKLKSDGSWDLIFANNGNYTIPVVGSFKIVAAVDANDNLYLTTAASRIVKISKSGDYLDAFTSTANLYLTQIISHILPLTDGSILFSGNELIEQRSLIIQKLKPSGEQDTSFGENGKSIVRYNGKYNTIADVQFFGSRIYVFGDINQSFFLAQLDKEGVLVPGFGSEGKVIIQFGASLSYGLKMKLYASGKALLLGSRQDWLGLARVVISETPTITASASVSSVCRETEFQLSGQGGLTYQWSGSNGFSSTEANPKVIVPESYAGSQVIFTLTGFNQDGFSSQDIITIDLKPKIQVETQEKLPCFGEERNHQVTISKNQYFDDKTIALFDESKASIVDENANFITFTFNKANSPLTLTLHDTTARYCDLTLSFDFRTNEEIKASLETTSIDSTCVSVVTPEDESSPLTYQWSNGGTSKIASPIPAGPFSVTITNSETGCQAVFEDECIPSTNANKGIVLSRSVYPNPVDNYLYIEVDNKGISGVVAFNTAGKAFSLPYQVENNRIVCKMDRMIPGLYQVMVLTQNGEKYLNKIVKL